MKTTDAKPIGTNKRYIFLTFGVLLIAVGVYFFKFPNNFSTGGFSGLSLILGRMCSSTVLTPSAFVFTINMALLIVGFIFLGRGFAFSTVYCSIVLSLTVNVMELFWPLAHPLTNQLLLELCFAVRCPLWDRRFCFIWMLPVEARISWRWLCANTRALTSEWRLWHRTLLSLLRQYSALVSNRACSAFLAY